MKKFSVTMVLLVVAASCVTINVYFPEAAAERAADLFIEEVIGDDEAATNDQAAAAPVRRPVIVSLIDFLIPSAQAQTPDLNINTPAVQQIQARMQERFQSDLRPFFDSGAVGFTNDGMVEVRELSAVPLPKRASLKQLVADDNRDRTAVYREIAVANGHPEWEPQVREAFAERWIANARTGWYYQDASGSWQRK